MRNDVACFGNMTACRGHGSFGLSLAAVAPPSVVHSIIYLLLRVALEERCADEWKIIRKEKLSFLGRA